MKLNKIVKRAHTATSQKGAPDFYGSGVRNPVGKVIEWFGSKNVSKTKISKAPKGLA